MTLLCRCSDGRGAVDPQHGLAAVGRRFALLDHAVAAQDPNVERTGLPVVARLGRNADRLGGVERRQLHLAGGTARSDEEEIAKCKMQIEKCKIAISSICIFQFAFCILHSSVCRAVSPPVRSDNAARQERASSSPSRFSRRASLLYRPHGDCPLCRPNRKINREKSLREKRDISSGGIIGILGQRIKAGWTGWRMSQLLIHQMVRYPWSEIFSADERAYRAGRKIVAPARSP